MSERAIAAPTQVEGSIRDGDSTEASALNGEAGELLATPEGLATGNDNLNTNETAQDHLPQGFGIEGQMDFSADQEPTDGIKPDNGAFKTFEPHHHSLDPGSIMDGEGQTATRNGDESMQEGGTQLDTQVPLTEDSMNDAAAQEMNGDALDADQERIEGEGDEQKAIVDEQGAEGAMLKNRDKDASGTREEMSEIEDMEGNGDAPGGGTEMEDRQGNGDAPDSGTETEDREGSGDLPGSGTETEDREGTGDLPGNGTETEDREGSGDLPGNGTETEDREGTGDRPGNGTRTDDSTGVEGGETSGPELVPDQERDDTGPLLEEEIGDPPGHEVEMPDTRSDNGAERFTQPSIGSQESTAPGFLEFSSPF